jgi:hypothetical protein
VVEQEATTQGIKMSKGVEPLLVTRQEIVVLLIVVEGVPMAIREI